MMREFNDETIFVLTPKSNGSMKETMQQDIAPGCRYGEHRNNGSTKVFASRSKTKYIKTKTNKNNHQWQFGQIIVSQFIRHFSS